MITALAWAVHCMVYPAFAVYVLLVTRAAQAFDDYIRDATEYWERRKAGVDHLECSTA